MMPKVLRYTWMILVLSVMGFSPLGFPQQPAVTTIAGGSGGTAFADVEVPNNARILQVSVFFGRLIDAVQMQYMLPNGQIMMGRRHGGPGGQERIFRIDSDEFITGISGRYDQQIDSIQFHTNKRSSEIYGGTGGRQDFALNVADGYQAIGFVGRSGTYLDAVGLAYIPQRILQMQKTSLAGGTGGKQFEDSAIPINSRISEVRIRSGKMIDSIQAVYTLNNGTLFEASAHGGNGGKLDIFRLDADEYIIGISGRSGNMLDSLTILTNKRSSPIYGGPGGRRDFKIEIPSGNQAVGFIGRSGNQLDAIGLSYAPDSRSPRKRSRFRMQQ
jgi:hypothetical protein